MQRVYALERALPRAGDALRVPVAAVGRASRASRRRSSSAGSARPIISTWRSSARRSRSSPSRANRRCCAGRRGSWPARGAAALGSRCRISTCRCGRRRTRSCPGAIRGRPEAFSGSSCARDSGSAGSSRTRRTSGRVLLDYLRSLGTETAWVGAALAVLGIALARRRAMAGPASAARDGRQFRVHGAARIADGSLRLAPLLRSVVPDDRRCSRAAAARPCSSGCHGARARSRSSCRRWSSSSSGFPSFDRSRYRIAEDYSAIILRDAPAGQPPDRFRRQHPLRADVPESRRGTPPGRRPDSRGHRRRAPAAALLQPGPRPGLPDASSQLERRRPRDGAGGPPLPSVAGRPALAAAAPGAGVSGRGARPARAQGLPDAEPDRQLPLHARRDLRAARLASRPGGSSRSRRRRPRTTTCSSTTSG